MELVDTAISVAAHVEAELEEALAEHRLTRPSFLVLDALDRAAGHTLGQRELVGRVRRTSGTLSVRLGRLERARLITREPDPESRRSVTVTLTERGQALVAAARPAYAERAQRLAAGLPEGAAGPLEQSLAAWLAFFEPGEGETPRLGVAVATAAVAKRMRRAVGLADEPGVLIVRVTAGSPADAAGLSRGDLITAAGDAPVRSVGDLERAVRHGGATVSLSVLRGAEPRQVEVALPAVALARAVGKRQLTKGEWGSSSLWVSRGRPPASRLPLGTSLALGEGDAAVPWAAADLQTPIWTTRGRGGGCLPSCGRVNFHLDSRSRSRWVFAVVRRVNFHPGSAAATEVEVCRPRTGSGDPDPLPQLPFFAHHTTRRTSGTRRGQQHRRRHAPTATLSAAAPAPRSPATPATPRPRTGGRARGR